MHFTICRDQGPVLAYKHMTKILVKYIIIHYFELDFALLYSINTNEDNFIAYYLSQY